MERSATPTPPAPRVWSVEVVRAESPGAPTPRVWQVEIARSALPSPPFPRIWSVEVDRSRAPSPPPARTWSVEVARSSVLAPPPPRAWSVEIVRAATPPPPEPALWAVEVARSGAANDHTPVLHLVRIEMPTAVDGPDKVVVLDGTRGYTVHEPKKDVTRSVAADVPERIVLGEAFTAAVETLRIWAPNGYVYCRDDPDATLGGPALKLRPLYGRSFIQVPPLFGAYASAPSRRPMCDERHTVESGMNVWAGVDTQTLRVQGSYTFAAETPAGESSADRRFTYSATTLAQPIGSEPSSHGPAELFATNDTYDEQGNLAEAKEYQPGLAIVAHGMTFIYEPVIDPSEAIPLPPPHLHPEPPEALPEPGEEEVAPEATADLTPSNPDVSRLIGDWLAVAEPPQNATEGASLHYDAWGRVVGSTRGGTITVSGPPDVAAGQPSTDFVWAKRLELDSIDHCRLGEYVERQLSGEGIADCAGRYQRAARVAPTDDHLVGLRLGEAAARVTDAGYEPVPTAGDPAPSADLAGTVASVGEPDGDRIELKVYIVPVTTVAVPDVAGRRLGEAAELLAGRGLRPQPELGEPAPSRELSGTVYRQEPRPSSQVTAAATVHLWVHGEFVEPMRTVPSLSGLQGSAAASRLAEHGLRISSSAGRAGPFPGSEGQVYQQEPAAGASVPPGTTVRVWTYSTATPLVPPPPIPATPPAPSGGSTDTGTGSSSDGPIIKSQPGVVASPGGGAGGGGTPPPIGSTFDCEVGLQSIGVTTVDELYHERFAGVERMGDGRVSFGCSYRVQEIADPFRIGFSWIEDPYTPGTYTFGLNCDPGLNRMHMRPGDPGVDTAFYGGGGGGRAAVARTSDWHVGGVRLVDQLGVERYEAIAERILTRIRPWAVSCPGTTEAGTGGAGTGSGARATPPPTGVSGGCMWVMEHEVSIYGLPDSGVQVPVTCQCLENGSFQIAPDSRCADQPRP